MSNLFTVFKQLFSLQEIQVLINDVQKYESQALAIHGNRKMIKLETVFPCEYIKSLFQKVSSKIPNYEEGIDCSVVFTEPGSDPQEWHMDALQKFPVVNIVLNSLVATEFLDVPYQPCFQEGTLNYPACWTSGTEKVVKPDVGPGDGILFWANCIHRGPSLSAQNTDTRWCLFMSFRTTSTRPTTDYVFANWNWLDRVFGSDRMRERPWPLIDFLMANPDLLNIYPKVLDEKYWIRQSILDQIGDRKLFNRTFPNNLEMYDIIVLGKHRLVSLLKRKQGEIKLYFYPERQGNEEEESVQAMNEKSFYELHPLKITRKNLATIALGGFNFVKTQSDLTRVESTIFVYPFTHRLDKQIMSDGTSILMKIEASRQRPVFIHPLLFCKAQSSRRINPSIAQPT